MRLWDLSKSTLKARMAFSGYECRWQNARVAFCMIPRMVFGGRDLEVAPTEEGVAFGQPIYEIM